MENIDEIKRMLFMEYIKRRQIMIYVCGDTNGKMVFEL